MSARPRARAIAAGVALILAGCDGYADLPLPLRELGPLRVERAERFSEGPGLVQIALDPPSDALGPFVVVGHPTILSEGASVLAWAYGTCRGAPAAADPAQRLCLAVTLERGGTIPGPLAVAVVVESRGDARRFTLKGTEPTGDVP
jgi:hypothetical protein